MCQRNRRALVLVTALLAAGGCSGSIGRGNPCVQAGTCGTAGGDGGTTTGGSLTVSPPNATVQVKGGPGTQQFTARDRGGNDVTAQCTWTVSNAAIGSVSAGGLFTTGYPLTAGGTVVVQANYKSNTGAASVTIAYTAPDVIDNSAPGGAALFNGPQSTDPAETPKVVYPFDTTMLARNINQMNLQWKGSPKDLVFHIHVVGNTIDSSFYVGQSVCSGGTKCSYTFADADWQTIAASATGQQVTLVVRGTQTSNSPIAASSPVRLNFSPEDVKGGLYYFSTSIRGLMRLPFGAKAPLPYLPNGGGPYNCAGCHSVSRDGKKVAATFWGGDGTGGIVDGANGQNFILQPENYQQNPQRRWNFSSFNPDGTLLLTNWAGQLTVRDSTTGAVKSTVPPKFYGGKEAVMPEWSPDGMSIVFVAVPAEGYLGKDMPGAFNSIAGDWILGNAGSIMTMPYNNGAFGPATMIVPSVKFSEYHFYPSWSPDSKWIVFATGRYPGSSQTAANNQVMIQGKCTSYDQDTARLRLVKAAGGAVVELSAATHILNKVSSWPKFTPFLQNSGKLVFFTFSSKFDYGFVVTSGMQPQIWMSAIDLDKANAELGASDPSYPPFWLPFQDPTQNNHSTIWTTDVACTGQGTDCPPEFTCQNGMCVPKVG